MNKETIAKLKTLSNLDYCESAEDMQDALEKINDLLNELYPEIEEE
jgi:hypothetical protein